MMGHMATQVVVVNGGSSSGKTSIVRCLVDVLPGPWTTFGVDALIDELPPSVVGDPEWLVFHDDGRIDIGHRFAAAQALRTAQVADAARAGSPVILDDVFLGGGASQERLRAVLHGLDVLWVGVRCRADVAAQREYARGDRTVGMAASQAESVHAGVRYDVEVDSARLDAPSCARVIARYVRV